MGPWYYSWGGWWPFAIIVPIVILLFMFVMMRMMFGRGGFMMPMCGHSMGHPDHEHGEEAGAAMEILKTRYAKGEITKEEFARMKADLLS